MKFFSKTLVIGALLFLLGLTLSLTFYITNDISLTTVSYNHTNGSLETQKGKPLLAGEKIKGEITSQKDNLGIIYIRFDNKKQVDDTIIFRIKEKNSPKWYTQQRYLTKFFFYKPFFPFGFPFISNSKNKTYEFEIESLYGTKASAISLSDEKPLLISKYQVSHSDLKKTHLFLSFIYSKVLYGLSQPDAVRYTFLYFSPFMLLLLWQLLNRANFHNRWQKKIIAETKKNVFNLTLWVLFLIFIDISLLKTIFYPILLGISLLWIITIKKYRYSHKETFIMAFCFLCVSYLLYISQLFIVAQRAAYWLYIFLCIGCVQAVNQVIVKSNSLTDEKDL